MLPLTGRGAAGSGKIITVCLVRFCQVRVFQTRSLFVFLAPSGELHTHYTHTHTHTHTLIHTHAHIHMHVRIQAALHIGAVLRALQEGVDYVEHLLFQQVVAAIGKEVNPADFQRCR
jgi:hypothetical protein